VEERRRTVGLRLVSNALPSIGYARGGGTDVSGGCAAAVLIGFEVDDADFAFFDGGLFGLLDGLPLGWCG
jgi:hypothetical protein